MIDSNTTNHLNAPDNVKTFFVAPTAFRAIKQADPHAELSNKYDLSSLKVFELDDENVR